MDVQNQIPTIDMEATGQNIMRLRTDRGIAVKDLQEIFGFATPQAIYKWQHGTALPTVDNLLILSNVLHVQIENILVVKGGIRDAESGDRAGSEKGVQSQGFGRVD